MRVRSGQDLGAGILFATFGAAGVIFGEAYTRGSAAQMGPGYFPFLLSVALLAIGAFLTARSLLVTGPGIERFVIRPYVFASAAILLFAGLIAGAGLAVTTVVMTLVASAASQNVAWREAAILSVALAGGSVALFVYVLGQPLTIFGS
jgi:hypothetical protein